MLEDSRLDLHRRSFVYRGAILWNRLPASVRKEKTLKKLETSAKIGFRRTFTDLDSIFLVLFISIYNSAKTS